MITAWEPNDDHRMLALGLDLSLDGAVANFLGEMTLGPTMDIDGMFKDYVIRLAGEREAKRASRPAMLPPVVWSATGRVDSLGEGKVGLTLARRTAEHGPVKERQFRTELPLVNFHDEAEVAALWGKPVTLALYPESELPTMGTLADRVALAEAEVQRLRTLTKVLAAACGVKVGMVELHARSCVFTLPGDEDEDGLAGAFGDWLLKHGATYPEVEAKIAEAERRTVTAMAFADKVLGWILGIQENPAALPEVLAVVARMTRERPEIVKALRDATEALAAAEKKSVATDEPPDSVELDDEAPDSE